jgi:hypothetical protein
MTDSPFKDINTTKKLSDLKTKLLTKEINKSEDYNIYKKDTVEISLSNKLKNKLDKGRNNV